MWVIKYELKHDYLKIAKKASKLKRKSKKRSEVFKFEEGESVEFDNLCKGYDSKKAKAEDIFKGTGWRKELLEGIHDSYDQIQEKGRLEDLRSDLFYQNKNGFCAFCGMLDASELDHFLPRKVYKPLSLHPKNLIPVCGKCNKKKMTVDGSEGNRFLHSYFDFVPEDEQFFFAVVDIDGCAINVKFSVEKIDGISEDIYSAMKFQLDKVDFNNRVRRQVNLVLFELSTFLEISDSKGVRVILERHYKKCRERYGFNHWKTVFIKALAESNDFCNGGYLKVLKSI